MDPRDGSVIRITAGKRPGLNSYDGRYTNRKPPKGMTYSNCWVVREFLSPSHPAYGTAHESNKDKWGMPSLPEISLGTIASLIYLGSVDV